jgi:hypothetical protein
VSVPTPAEPAASGELATIRQLFERKLVDRATQLAETRWPGSGQMVTLANDWAHLTPAARRERLAAIGPADLARLRGLANLQPDLARVLDDLEQRGVLPSATELATTSASRDEVLVDAVLHGGEAAMHDVANQARARQLAPLPPQTAAALLESPEPIAQVDWPELDLGLPSTAEVLAQEAQRRQEAAAAAEAALERVRQRVERSTTSLLSSQPASTPSAAVNLLTPQPSIATEAVVAQPAFAAAAPAAANAAQRTLADRVESEVVFQPRGVATV